MVPHVLPLSRRRALFSLLVSLVALPASWLLFSQLERLWPEIVRMEGITFMVERLRDGRSFSARRVHALQGGQPILSLTASFQEDQPGLEHTDSPPERTPPPESVPAIDQITGLAPISGAACARPSRAAGIFN